MKVRTRITFPYLLPRGLGVGAEVSVLRVDGSNCLVLDSRGREWTVATVSVDPGRCVWVQGHWVNDESYQAA
jgi:hypothetical protein